MKSKLTIKDIAKHANTSIATVSRVINNNDYPVKESLRKKVLEAISELNYAPNLVGKQLKTNASNEIGVIIPNISNPYYTLLVSGLEKIVREQGHYILLCNTNGDPELEKKYLQYLYQKQVQGIIIASVSTDTHNLAYLKDNGMKIVAFEQDIEFDCHKINFDYFRGGYMAAEHLYKKGHTDIGFISAPLTRHSRKKVFEGYWTFLEKHGLEDEKFIKIGGKEMEVSGEIFEYQNGKNLVSELIDAEKLPTALFCINDMTAFGVIQQLQNNGIRIPEDIAVMGFDNIDICEMVTPSLTTIDQSTFEMGRLAAETLMYSLKNDTKNSITNMLQPTLIERNSTKTSKDL